MLKLKAHIYTEFFLLNFTEICWRYLIMKPTIPLIDESQIYIWDSCPKPDLRSKYSRSHYKILANLTEIC
jgi:hypothetical protein